MVMGRPNKGVLHVDSCEGSQLSKRRAKAVLRTITGDWSVLDALGDLDVQRPYFATLRSRALQAVVDALEPGRPGRKPKRDAATDQRVTELSSKVADLERQLQIERARAELAPLLPGRTDDQKGGGASRQERRKRERELRKTARRQPRQRSS